MTYALPQLIALTGDNGAGKTTVAKCLRSAYDYRLHSFAEPLKSYLRELGVPWSSLHGTPSHKEEILPTGGTGRRGMMHVASATKAIFGRDIFARALVQNIKLHLKRGSRIVIDDLRFDEEEIALRKLGAVFWLVRRTADDTTSISVDRVIDNTEDIPALYQRVAEALNALDM